MGREKGPKFRPQPRERGTILPLGEHWTKKEKVRAGLHSIEMADQDRKRDEERESRRRWPLLESSQGSFWKSGRDKNVVDISEHRPAKDTIRAIKRFSFWEQITGMKRDGEIFDRRADDIVNPKKPYVFPDFDK